MTSIDSEQKNGFNPKVLAIIFLAHFSGDLYQSFITPLLPLIKESLGLSLTQVGFVMSTVVLTGFLSQPVMGLLADRFGPRAFLLTGLVLGAVLVPLMAVTPWYGLVVLLAGLGAMGSSMYHPTAAALVHQFAGSRGALSMSIFGLGGTMGYGVGPLAIAYFISQFGLDKVPYTTSLGLIAILAVVLLLPPVERSQTSQTSIRDNLRAGLGSAWKPIMALWLMGALRSFADSSIRTYYPIMYVEQGESLVSMGFLLSLFVMGGSASALVCGEIADRKGFKVIFYGSYILSTPALLLFLYSQGWAVYPTAFIAGFILMATMFPSVALANNLAPHNRSLASSLTLGFAVGTGGFMSPLVGQVAEVIGIKLTLQFIAFAPLICLFLIPLIPNGKQSQSETLEDAA